MSQGPANSSIAGLVQEVGKTHKTSLGQLQTGRYQYLSKAAISNVDPAFASVPEKVQPSLRLSVHVSANATSVCALGSEQGDSLCVWPPLPSLKDCQKFSKGKSSISGVGQGWGEEGEPAGARHCLSSSECTVLLNLCSSAVNGIISSILHMKKLRL